MRSRTQNSSPISTHTHTHTRGSCTERHGQQASTSECSQMAIGANSVTKKQTPHARTSLPVEAPPSLPPSPHSPEGGGRPTCATATSNASGLSWFGFCILAAICRQRRNRQHTQWHVLSAHASPVLLLHASEQIKQMLLPCLPCVSLVRDEQ